MKNNEIIELDTTCLQEISGGTSTTYNFNINVNIAPTISITFINKINLGILVIAGSVVNKPVTFVQGI